MQSVTDKPLRSSWSIHPLIWLLCGSLLLNVGNKIYEIVLPLMMYDMTHSSVVMTSMRTAELLPNLLFGILIGVIVDRVNTRKWVLWMVSLQAVILLLLAVLFKLGNVPLWPYYLGGFLLLTFGYGYFNAQISLTKQVADPDKLTSANAKFSLAETLVSIVGPMLGAGILMMSDKSDGLLIPAAIFGAGFLVLGRISVPVDARKASATHKSGSFRSDLREGWAVFRNNVVLRTVTLFALLINCTTVVFQTTLLFYAKDELGISSGMTALLFGVSGVGGLLGSLLIQRVRAGLGLGKTIGLTTIVNAAVYGSVYLAPTLPVLIAALFIFGFTIAIFTICVYTLRHEQTPVEHMGRIGGITGTFFRVGMPAAMFASGWIMQWWSPSLIFAGLALWNAVVFLFYVRTWLWKERTASI